MATSGTDSRISLSHTPAIFRLTDDQVEQEIERAALLSQTDKVQAGSLFESIRNHLRSIPLTTRAKFNKTLHLFTMIEKLGPSRNDSQIITACLNSLETTEKLIEEEPDLQTQRLLFQKVKSLYERIAAFEQNRNHSNAMTISLKAQACQTKINNLKLLPASNPDSSPKIPENPLVWSLLTYLVIFVISGISLYAYFSLKDREIIPIKN